MPKKTRSQKIIANLRRQLTVKEKNLKIEKSAVSEKSLTTQPPLQHEQQQKVPFFVINDLKKSLFLTALAISLELVLYYLLELGGFGKLGFLLDNLKKVKFFSSS